MKNVWDVLLLEDSLDPPYVPEPEVPSTATFAPTTSGTTTVSPYTFGFPAPFITRQDVRRLNDALASGSNVSVSMGTMVPYEITIPEGTLVSVNGERYRVAEHRGAALTIVPANQAPPRPFYPHPRNRKEERIMSRLLRASWPETLRKVERSIGRLANVEEGYQEDWNAQFWAHVTREQTAADAPRRATRRPR